MEQWDSKIRNYSISELASEFGVTARTLRFYEDKGLLNPKRSGQMRIYSGADRARLRLILRGKRVGFTLEEIREMMELKTLDAGGTVHLSVSLQRFRNQINTLKQQRSDIELSIAELEAGCAWLEAKMINREPSEEIKQSARAFEALALARLEH